MDGLAGRGKMTALFAYLCMSCGGSGDQPTSTGSSEASATDGSSSSSETSEGESHGGTTAETSDATSDSAESSDDTGDGCTDLDQETCWNAEECTTTYGALVEVLSASTFCIGSTEYLGCVDKDATCGISFGCQGDERWLLEALGCLPPGFEACDPPAGTELPC